MVQVAEDRIEILFRRAEEASTRGFPEYADRYVQQARRIGTRYNVRLPAILRDQFCRGCLAYFREGSTVRTRLRGGHRTRTCLRCGRSYRVPIRRRTKPTTLPPDEKRQGPVEPAIGVPVDELGEDAEEPEVEPDEV